LPTAMRAPIMGTTSAARWPPVRAARGAASSPRSCPRSSTRARRCGPAPHCCTPSTRRTRGRTRTCPTYGNHGGHGGRGDRLFQPDLHPQADAVQAVLDLEENPGARTTSPADVTDYRYADQCREDPRAARRGHREHLDLLLRPDPRLAPDGRRCHPPPAQNGVAQVALGQAWHPGMVPFPATLQSRAAGGGQPGEDRLS